METILVLTDFSKRAQHAAEFALEIAAKANAELLLYNTFYAPQAVPLESGVYPYYEDYAEIEQQGIQKMEKLIQELNERFIDAHQTPSPAIRILNEPGKLGENVSAITSKQDIWMVVMGDKSDEGTVSRFIFGSDSSSVIDNANCPVLLIPEKAELKDIKKILFATELQQTEHAAMVFLENLAKAWHSQITVFHVCEKRLSVEEKASHYDYYKEILSGIQYPDINYVDVRGVDVSETISTYAAREKIDLIAMVHKKRSFIGSLLHESISKKMLNYHKAPLLILHKS